MILRINKPGHPFNGYEVIVTTSSSDGHLDCAYYSRHRDSKGVDDLRSMTHPVAVIICAQARSATQLMDILDADELVIDFEIETVWCEAHAGMHVQQATCRWAHLTGEYVTVPAD
jgi:hypothetical protein